MPGEQNRRTVAELVAPPALGDSPIGAVLFALTIPLFRLLRGFCFPAQTKLLLSQQGLILQRVLPLSPL